MPPKQRPHGVELPRAGGRPSIRLLLGLLGAAAIVTATAIALSLTRGRGHTTATAGTPVIGSVAFLAGIPQNGLVLGNPKAKVTLTEYIDTSCPICKDYVLTTFPSIVKAYVRTGKVKIEARVVSFVGPSSTRGRELVLAAARQNKAWQLTELAYRNQGDEATAWLTDDLARALAGDVPGLNVDKLFADSSSADVRAQTVVDDASAQADGVTGTPTFVLTTRDGKRHLLGAGNPGFAAFIRVFDRALKG